MVVEVSPTYGPAGSLGLNAKVAGSPATFMNAILVQATGELYVSSYAVEPALRGSHRSATLFDAIIQAASDHGDVRVIRGIPSGPNLEVLIDSDGKAVAENVSLTPWAKVLADLGYDTVLPNGLLESFRKDAI